MYVCIILPFSRSINGPHSYKYTYILHVADFRCILVGGLNIYISHYFKCIGTLKTVGGGGQHRLYILVIYYVQKKNLAVSEGRGLNGFLQYGRLWIEKKKSKHRTGTLKIKKNKKIILTYS